MRHELCEYQPAVERSPLSAETVEYGKWIDRGILLAALLAGSLSMSRNLADPDLWGHVQYGRDALQAGLPATTTYSYIAEGHPWFNHEIVAEIAMATAADWFGTSGLLIIKTLLGMAILGAILWRAIGRGVGVIPTTIVLLLVGLALGDHWTVRPQLFSYAFTTLLLALLDWSFAGWEGNWWLPRFFWRRNRGYAGAFPDEEGAALDYSLERLRYLWLAPILFLVWTNAHGGFLAGLCIYSAYLGLRSLEAVAQLGWDAVGLLKRFAMMATVAVVATFLNPYSYHFHTWLYEDLKVPRPEILEWRAPDFTDPLSWPIGVLAVVAIAAILFTRRSRDFTQVVILGLLIWQTLEHARHGAFLALAFGFWLPRHIGSALARIEIGREKSFGETMLPFWRSGFVGGLLALYLLLGTQLYVRLKEMPVERNTYPVSALEFLAQEKLEGKIVCTFNWAQYLLAALGPEKNTPGGLRVHVDGRCRTSYSQQMLDEHFDFILGDVGPNQRYRDPESGPFDPKRVLKSGSPDLVLLCRLQPVSEETMHQQARDWVLLYQDTLAQVWGRRDRYARATSPHYLPPSRRRITDAAQVGSVNWPALPSRAKSSGNLASAAVR
jgi:hypothetical protein